MQNAEILKNLRTYTSKGKFPEELSNLSNYYSTKQSRIRKVVLFICSENPQRLLAMGPFIPLPFFLSKLRACSNIVKNISISSLLPRITIKNHWDTEVIPTP